MCDEVLHLADVKVSFSIKVTVSTVCAVNTRNYSSMLPDFTFEVVFRESLFAAISYFIERCDTCRIVTEFNLAIDLMG